MLLLDSLQFVVAEGRGPWCISLPCYLSLWVSSTGEDTVSGAFHLSVAQGRFAPAVIYSEAKGCSAKKPGGQRGMLVVHIHYLWRAHALVLPRGQICEHCFHCNMNSSVFNKKE